MPLVKLDNMKLGMLDLVVGLGILIILIIAVVYSVSKTPPNLQGFYGIFYVLIGASSLIAAIYLIVKGIIQII